MGHLLFCHSIARRLNGLRGERLEKIELAVAEVRSHIFESNFYRTWPKESHSQLQAGTLGPFFL